MLSHLWQSKIALLTALGMTSTAAIPLVMSAPVGASSPSYTIGQLFPQSSPESSQVVIPSGTTLPVRYDKAEKIIVSPEETSPVTLTIAADVRSRRGTILIPAGSRVEGELRPATGGTQFFAQELILGNSNSEQGLPINATSSVITETETISEKTDPDILRGAAIGAGAGALLSGILGNVSLGEVLAGAGVGVAAELLLRGRKEVEVVVVNPDTDLDLTLQSDLPLSRPAS